MRILFIIAILSTGCSTSIKSPMTQFEYTGYIRAEGVGVTIKPPLWDAAVGLYRSWNEEDNNKDTK